jgi:hypothetical protein
LQFDNMFDCSFFGDSEFLSRYCTSLKLSTFVKEISGAKKRTDVFCAVGRFQVKSGRHTKPGVFDDAWGRTSKMTVIRESFDSFIRSSIDLPKLHIRKFATESAMMATIVLERVRIPKRDEQMTCNCGRRYNLQAYPEEN